MRLFCDLLTSRQVMLIVPKASATEFLLGSTGTLIIFEKLLVRLLERYKKPYTEGYTSDYALEWIVQTCQRHLTRTKYRDPQTKDSFLGRIATTAISIGCQDLFRNAVHSTTNGFDDESFTEIGDLIDFEMPVVSEDE